LLSNLEHVKARGQTPSCPRPPRPTYNEESPRVDTHEQHLVIGRIVV